MHVTRIAVLLVACTAFVITGCGGGGGSSGVALSSPAVPGPIPLDPIEIPGAPPDDRIDNPSPDPVDPVPVPVPDPNPVDPPPPPDPPPSETEEDFAVAEHMRDAFEQINYDVHFGNAGLGVKVALLDAGFDPMHPVHSGRSVSMPLTVDYRFYRQSSVDHGTIVGMIAIGLRDKSVHGVAYQSSLEFVCCIGTGDDNDSISALGHLAQSSDAFVVNNSWGWYEKVSYDIESPENCEKHVSGINPQLPCRNRPQLNFSLPRQNFSYLEGLYLPWACIDPDMGKVNAADNSIERLCVFAAGNDGLHLNGVVSGGGFEVYPKYNFRVSDLLGDESPFSEAAKEEFRNRLYSRGGLQNLPEVNRDFAGHYLVVVALGEDEDVITDYSNGCGEAMLHCIAAPGNLPFQLCDTEESGICDGLIEGTSLAAPLVSGAAAVLKSTYPQLSAPNVVSILLETADDLGEDGPDVDYGMGKLNVMESMSPVGEEESSVGESLVDTKIVSGPSLGAAIEGSAASFGMLDAYGRPYLHSVADRHARRGAGADEGMKAMAQSAAARVDEDLRLRMGLSGTGSGRASSPGFARPRDAHGWAFSSGYEACRHGCLSQGGVMAGSLVPSSALAWSESHVRAKHGIIGLAMEAGLEGEDEIGYISSGLFYAGTAGDSLFRLEAGALRESGTFMGSEFGGALAVGAGEGNYMSASFGTEIGEGAFSARYTSGRESPGAAFGSYVTEVSPVVYDGYRLAYGMDDWELHYTVPLAATEGAMSIESVSGYTGENGDWSIVRSHNGVSVVGESSSDGWQYRTDSHRIDFGAGKRERRLGLTMSEPRGAWDVLVAVEHVSNSPRRAFAGNEVRAVVELSLLGD